MRTKRVFMRATGAVALACGLTAGAGTMAHAQEMTLRMHHFLPL